MSRLGAIAGLGLLGLGVSNYNNSGSMFNTGGKSLYSGIIPSSSVPSTGMSKGMGTAISGIAGLTGNYLMASMQSDTANKALEYQMGRDRIADADAAKASADREAQSTSMSDAFNTGYKKKKVVPVPTATALV